MDTLATSQKFNYLDQTHEKIDEEVAPNLRKKPTKHIHKKTVHKIIWRAFSIFSRIRKSSKVKIKESESIDDTDNLPIGKINIHDNQGHEKCKSKDMSDKLNPNDDAASKKASEDSGSVCSKSSFLGKMNLESLLKIFVDLHKKKRLNQNAEANKQTGSRASVKNQTECDAVNTERHSTPPEVYAIEPDKSSHTLQKLHISSSLHTIIQNDILIPTPRSDVLPNPANSPSICDSNSINKDTVDTSKTLESAKSSDSTLSLLKNVCVKLKTYLVDEPRVRASDKPDSIVADEKPQLKEKEGEKVEPMKEEIDVHSNQHLSNLMKITQKDELQADACENQANVVEQDEANDVEENHANTVEENKANIVAEIKANLVQENADNAVEETQFNAVEETQVNAVEENQDNDDEQNQANTVEESQVNTVEDNQADTEKNQVNVVEENQLNVLEENQDNALEENQINVIEENQTNAVEANHVEENQLTSCKNQKNSIIEVFSEKKLAYNIVEGDIKSMIKELLKESKDIKYSIVATGIQEEEPSSFTELDKVNTYTICENICKELVNAASMKSKNKKHLNVTFKSDTYEDVEYILANLIENVLEIKLPSQTKPICVSFCLIQDNLKDKNLLKFRENSVYYLTKKLRKMPSKKISYTPKVTVRNLSTGNHIRFVTPENSLSNRIRRSAALLMALYDEMRDYSYYSCTSNILCDLYESMIKQGLITVATAKTKKSSDNLTPITNALPHNEGHHQDIPEQTTQELHLKTAICNTPIENSNDVDSINFPSSSTTNSNSKPRTLRNVPSNESVSSESENEELIKRFVFPTMKYTYESDEEVNTPEEVKIIDDNVEINAGKSRGIGINELIALSEESMVLDYRDVTINENEAFLRK